MLADGTPVVAKKVSGERFACAIGRISRTAVDAG
jgi:hypothetical protein